MFSDLQNPLKRPPDGILRLDGSTLSDSIGSLFADFLPGGRFEAKVEEPENTTFRDGNKQLPAVKVQGTLLGEFLGVSGLKVEAWFFVTDGGRAEVAMTVGELPDLSRSFPGFQEAAAFSKCAFALDSRRLNPLGGHFDQLFSAAKDARRGLSLADATLNVPSVDKTVADYGVSSDSLHVRGPVELQGGSPRMWLTTAQDISLPDLLPNAHFSIGYQYLTAPVNGSQKTRERLCYKLVCGTGPDALSIPLAITFAPNMLTDKIIVESDWKADSSPLSLTTLTRLLPKEVSDSLNGLLPQKSDTVPDILAALDRLKLAKLVFQVENNPLSLSGVSARVELDLDWTIVKGTSGKALVKFGNLAMDLNLANYGDEWLVSPYLSGTLTLSGGKLTGIVDLSAGSFFCTLDDDPDGGPKNEVDLKQLITETLGLPKDTFPFDNFALSRFEIWGDISGATYYIDIGTTFSWSLPWKVGKNSLTIRDLFLKLEYDGSLTPALGGSLELFGMTLSCLATYSQKDGWTFAITVLDLSLTELLASTLGDQAQAKQLPEVTFPGLELKVTTSTGAFSFHGVAEIVWEKPFGIDASFSCKVELQLEGGGAKEGERPIKCKIEITGKGKFTVNGKELDSTLRVAAKNDKGALELEVEGALKIAGLEFNLYFSKEPKAQTFVAAYYEEGGRKISIDDLLAQVFAEPITTGVELTLKDALFAYRGDEDVARYVFGLDIGIDIGLAKLPVVGPALPADLKVGVDNLQILAATRAFNPKDVTAVNRLVPEKVTKLPSGKADGGDAALKQGLNVSANLKLGGTSKLLMPPASGGTSTGGEGAAAALAATPPATPAAKPPATLAAKPPAGISKWFDVQKNVGPLRLERLGVQWKNQRLGFLFDAGMDLLGVRLDLLGLAITLPLKNPRVQDLGFELDGLELSVKQKPLEISGALLKVYPTGDKISLQYDGRVLVRAEVFSLAALGSYAVVNDRPSLFIFAVLHKELGGPAFFFVTGLAFGFGVNRLLKLPTIEEVHNFPLVRGATDPEYFGSAATPRTALAKLQEYIPPSVGDYWLAAGVKFNSFGMIDSFAVLSVSFGTQFQIAILGLSRITVPRQLPGAAPIEPIACAELALKVSFTLSSGLLAAEARLTENSFVLSKDCKLRGGFALYCWLGPDHAGDFVVTLGGYHPKFPRPSHYPIVPRLGMNWKVGENLALCGELYFALTPSCLMAGGKLSAAFQAGPIRAWFFASCDFLINWQPFAYDIAVGIRIGVAFVLGSGDTSQALTIEIGAQLHLWGPPFGGIATISLYVISFDIAFGEPQQPVLEKVDWKTFHQSFLPQAPEADADPLLGSIRITAGLIKVQDVTKNGQKTKLNVVNAHELQFTTESVVPATSVLLNNKAVESPGVAARAVGVRPMDIKSLTSVHAVTLTPKTSLPAGWDAHLAPSLTTKSVPEALWSNKGLTRVERPSADMVDAALNGATVSLRHRAPSHGLAPIDLKKFEYDRIPKDIEWKEWQPPVPIAAPGDNTLANTIWGNDAVNATRKAILKALGKDPARVDLRNLAEASTEIFQSEPDMARLGEPFKQNLYAG